MLPCPICGQQPVLRRDVDGFYFYTCPHHHVTGLYAANSYYAQQEWDATVRHHYRVWCYLPGYTRG